MTRGLQAQPDRMSEAREIDLALLYELGPGAGHGDDAKRQSALP